MEPVAVARGMTDRKMQRALLQFFKPENYFEVHRALLAAGRADLIGDGGDALIPATPPREAIEAKRAAARKAAGPSPGADLDQGGYSTRPRRRRPPATVPAARPRAGSSEAPSQVGQAHDLGERIQSPAVTEPPW